MKRLFTILLGMAILYSLQAAYAQNVEFVASYDTPARATGVFVSGQYAYVADYADYTGSLQILSVVDPYNPASVGSLQTEYPAIDVLVSGDYAYVNEGHCGWFCIGDIEIIDVSNPANPDSVGGAGEGVANSFSVEGNYIYGISTPNPINGDNALYIIDASEPDSAFLVDSYGSYCDEDGWPSFGVIFVSGNFSYVNCGGHFQIWDISDPYNAGMVGSCLGGCATDIFAAGDFAYEACDEIGLSVVNVANPSDPYLLGTFETRGPARDVFVSGHYAYVAERDSGLQIFDISEPDNPVLAGGYDTPGYARRIYVQDDLIFVADTTSLMILRFNPQTGIEEIEGLPRQFALSQNYPNPFNATTTIRYSLSKASDVSIDIYDLLGRKVGELLNANRAAGEHQVVWDAGDFASGIYFARLQAGSNSDVIRMMLLK